MSEIIAPSPFQRIDWHLHNWADYMRGGTVTKGYPGKVSYDVAISPDFESIVDGIDERCARAVDALIHGLIPMQSNAVSVEYIGGHFVYDPALFSPMLEQAKINLSAGLEKKGIW